MSKTTTVEVLNYDDIDHNYKTTTKEVLNYDDVDLNYNVMAEVYLVATDTDIDDRLVPVERIYQMLLDTVASNINNLLNKQCRRMLECLVPIEHGTLIKF